MSGADSIQRLYEQGTELFNKGDYDEAAPLLEEVIQENPFYADVHNKLGIISSLGGDPEKAVRHFEEALKLNPSYTEAALNLTITYNDLGEHEKASMVMERAKSSTVKKRGTLDPYVAGKLANEHFKVGNIYLEFNLLEDAVQEYEKAVALRPGLADVHTKLGVALNDLGRHDEAIDHFRAAKASNPYYGPAWVQLGLAYYKKGWNELAIEEWEGALAKNPEMRDAQSFLNILRDKR